jgi:hypothetical protein
VCVCVCVCVAFSHLHLVQYLQARLEPTQIGPCVRLHYKARVLALLVNIRLGQMEWAVTNTPAYYNTELITVVKMSII